MKTIRGPEDQRGQVRIAYEVDEHGVHIMLIQTWSRRGAMEQRFTYAAPLDPNDDPPKWYQIKRS